MKVQFIRQAYPKAGGVVMPAGRIVDLPADVLRTYPPDAYKRFSEGTPPQKKPVGSPEKRRKGHGDPTAKYGGGEPRRAAKDGGGHRKQAKAPADKQMTGGRNKTG